MNVIFEKKQAKLGPHESAAYTGHRPSCIQPRDRFSLPVIADYLPSVRVLPAHLFSKGVGWSFNLADLIQSPFVSLLLHYCLLS